MTDLIGRSARDDVIAVEGLVKHFGRAVALDGLELSVRRGEIYAILGPIGSGKTSAIRILLGLLHPDAGRVGVLGMDPGREAATLHRRLAYVQGEVSLWPNLTGGEVIDLTARMHGGIVAARRDDLLDRFRLDPGRQGHTYSKVERQKLALVAALASNAELLLLDEPTAGLDRQEREALRQCVDQERAQGRTVLFTSHVLAEVESVADRVAIIDNGRILESGTLAELRHLRRTSIAAELDRPDSTMAEMTAVHDFEICRNAVRCEVDSDRLDEVLRRLLDCGLRSLTSQPPTLAQLLRRRSAAHS